MTATNFNASSPASWPAASPVSSWRRNSYYPFGGGQRMCAGSHFANVEAALVLATVGQRYRFTLEPDAEIDIKSQITLSPKYGIPATLRAR